MTNRVSYSLFIKHIHQPSRFLSRYSRLYYSKLLATRSELSVPDEYDYCSRLLQGGSKISAYWIDQLKALERPVAKSLINQLIPDNELGYDDGKSSIVSAGNRSGSFLGFTMEQKRKHPEKVILMRSGEFYETYGVDALMLINYAGLNPMGNKAKAGCPARNIQATLDGLTAAGLSVAVYEEIAEIDTGKGKSANVGKVKIKNRALTQIVSPASSTYIYDLCLRPDDIEFRENYPAVGIIRTTSGYTLCQVYLDEQAMVITERLTEEGVRALLASSGAIDPIYLQNVEKDTASSFLHGSHYETIRLDGYTELQFPEQILQRVGNSLEIETKRFRVNHNSHTRMQSTSSLGRNSVNRPRPIYTSTALQIGLLPNDNVPNLIPHMLPKVYTAVTSQFWRKWLLNPPPYEIADSMQRLCHTLSQTSVSLPPFASLPVGKVVSLLTAKQCNVALFRDIKGNVLSLSQLLELQEKMSISSFSSGTSSRMTDDLNQIVSSLLSLTTFLCGIPADSKQLLNGCHFVYDAIDAVVADALAPEEVSDVSSSFEILRRKYGEAVRIPDEFFRRNEEEFRNKVRPEHPQIQSLYTEVHEAAEALHLAIEKDVANDGSIEIVHDMMENALMLREKSVSLSTSRSKSKKASQDVSNDDSNAAGAKTKSNDHFIVYIDRKGKTMSKRYTTQRIREALDDYIRVVTAAPLVVSRILQNLSSTLVNELITIVQISHLAVVLQATLAHTTAALQRGWTLPVLVDLPEDPSGFAQQEDLEYALSLRGLTPYWLSRDTAVANNIDLFGIFLLTAPNMSGKSTLMRAILVSALLANAGCFIPALSGARIPRFDNFFLRTASYDVPSEAKSAFALEMDDMRVVLRDSSHRSLVMIDELGKGTSAKDGAALAGALLEYLADRQCFGVFATHLHELFLLPLSFPRQNVREKKMGYVKQEQSGRLSVEWTYQLDDGRCEDSMALVTATQYGIDSRILSRAEELLSDFDLHCRPRIINSASDSSLTPLPPRISSIPSGQIDATESTVDISSKTAPGQSVESKRTPSAKNEYQHYLRETVLPLLKGFDGFPEEDDAYVYIPAEFMPPASLEGTSCVYLLHIFPAKKPGVRGVFYVGETESLAQRLRQHRQFYRRNDCVLSCIAFSAPHKSAARRLETQLIQQLKKPSLLRDPLVFERDADAKHSLFSRELRE